MADTDNDGSVHEAEFEDDEVPSRYYDVDERYEDERYNEVDSEPHAELGCGVDDVDQYTTELPLQDDAYYEPSHPLRQRSPRPYRPGRGGFDPEAAELTKQARYAFRRRVVLGMVIAAVLTALMAIAFTVLWWAHLVIDLSLTGYLMYLRRQVRIEEDIRQRRLARMRGSSREPAMAHEREVHPPDEQNQPASAPQQRRRGMPRSKPAPGTAVVDVDDGDPAFDELDEPGVLPYRRASGE